MTRRTLLALGALLVSSTLSVVPADAAPPAMDLRGSYFGSFTSSTGNTLYSDLNVTLQARKLISGSVNMGGVLQDVAISGKCERNGRFTLAGVVRQGSARLRIRLNGKCEPGGNGELAVLTGQYQITGPRRERGTFRFSGQSNLPRRASLSRLTLTHHDSL